MPNFGCEAQSPSCPQVVNPCDVSRDEFICQALKLLPKGELWTRPGCNFYEFFCSIAATYWDQWNRICQLRTEATPCTADSTLDEWASIWTSDCDDLPTETQALRDELCALLQYRGVLTCEFITESLAAHGYIVTGCASDTTTTGEVITPICGFRTGITMVGSHPVLTQSCADQFTGPCASEYIAQCCDQDDPQDLIPVIDCDPQTKPFFHGDCNSSVGVSQLSESYSPLANPWTLCVTIDPASPGISQCCLSRKGSVTYANSQVGVVDMAQEITGTCAIDALKPAHLTIQYKVGCP